VGKLKSSVRARVLVPLFIGFLVMSIAFIAISYVEFRAYTIEDCVNYAYGLNSLIADNLDIDHVNDYIEQGRSHPDYERIEQYLYKLRNAYPDIVYLYVYQIREDGCHVVFDLDTQDVPASQPGEVVPFDQSFLKVIPDLLAGREVKPVISRDTYGFLLTIYTPLRDSNGVCQCYAAVDYSMDLLTAYVRSIIGQIILLFLIVILVIVVVSVLATDKGIIKPMKRLERRAYRDTLTGLQNRTAYYEYNRVLDKRIAEGTANFAILMVDVNFLKRMNDTHGHEKGNAYLKNASDLIGSVFGRDAVYRTGGNEFVIILDGEKQREAGDMIARFKAAVAERQVVPGLQPWERVSAAIGIATFDRALDTCTEDVLKRADGAMYRDKLAMKAERRD